MEQVNGITVEKYLQKNQTTLLAVYDGNDNLLRRYTYADTRMPVSLKDGGVTYFLLTDQVTTLRGLVDTGGTSSSALITTASGISSRTAILPSRGSLTLPDYMQVLR